MIPILYTQRDNPYAIRARLALVYAGIRYEACEVSPGQIPEELLSLSREASIPSLQLGAKELLGDSLAIMHWALLDNDPEGWIDYEVDELDEMNDLIRINDQSFYKDVCCYRESPHNYREAREPCCMFLHGLEQRLSQHRFLLSNRVSIADFAIYPFVYQCSQVEPEWFLSSPYERIKQWLAYHEASALHRAAMRP